MIEQIYKMDPGDQKNIEKIIADENIHLNHMILPKNEGLPVHYSNSNVYMTVLRGLLSIRLDEQEVHEYPAGSIHKIPEGVKMDVRNNEDPILELMVVKAPAPKEK